MFLIEGQFITDVEILFDRIAYRVQTSISHSRDRTALPAMIDGGIRSDPVHLFEMTFIYVEYRLCVDVIIGEDLIYPVRGELLMRLIRHILYQISYLFPHLLRKVDAVALLQDIIDTALAGLAVDADHVRIIS